MALRLLGAALVVASFTAGALTYIKGLKRRKTSLDEAATLLEEIRIKMSFLFTPIPVILKEIKENCHSCLDLLVCECISSLEEGYDLKKSWTEAVIKTAGYYFFSDSDIKMLCDFSQCLGDTDVSGQLANIELYAARIADSALEAGNEYSKKSRLSLSCGVSCGLVAAILLI